MLMFTSVECAVLYSYTYLQPNVPMFLAIVLQNLVCHGRDEGETNQNDEEENDLCVRLLVQR